MAYACYRRYLDTGSLNMLGLVVVNTISMAMFMFRRDATSVSSSPALWLIAFAGTLAPTLMRPTTPALLTTMGNALQLAGILCIVASLLSLRRSLGIVPAMIDGKADAKLKVAIIGGDPKQPLCRIPHID